MLVTLQEILKIAEERKCAIGSFNTPNMASIRAVLGAAESLGEPVILMHAQVHEEMGLCKMEEIAPVMRVLAERATVPVCLHLDHGTDLDYIKRGLELGFTSVMYDGSTLPEQENLANTRVARRLSREVGASLEAEIGSMGARESATPDAPADESIYTDPEAAERFVAETEIDALACAFGTAHGVYLKQPKLDFDRLAAIKGRVSVPLVMHGGSGVSVEDYRRVIGLGIRKINYYTYMAKAGGDAVERMTSRAYYHDVEVAAIQAMQRDVEQAMRVFVGKE